MVAGFGLVLLLARKGHAAGPGLVAILCAHNLALMLWRGETSTWRGPATRGERPGRYWAEAGLYVIALGLGAVGLLTR